MLGSYQKQCENHTWFQAGFQFENLKVSHYVMPLMKLDYKVLSNAKTEPLKPA
jgi:hypothetical protein